LIKIHLISEIDVHVLLHFRGAHPSANEVSSHSIGTVFSALSEHLIVSVTANVLTKTF